MSNNDDSNAPTPLDWKKLRQEYRQSDAEGRVRWMHDHAGSLGVELSKNRYWNVARTCVSFQQSDDIPTLQRIAFAHWHNVILKTATNVEATTAFQVLCNCITQNEETSRLLMTCVAASPPHNTSNWVDLILSHRSDRTCLAAVVACWYNARILLTTTTTTAAPLLLETFLRQAVTKDQKDDDATEWIRRAISLYSCMHGMRESYESLGHHVVVPEQVVFLLLLLQSIEGDTSKSFEVLGGTPDMIQDNLRFLLQLVVREKPLDPIERSLHRDICHLAMELVNEASTDDCDRASNDRQALGQTPGLWYYLLVRLAEIVDDWNKVASVKKARDTPSLPDDEQRCLINGVRCIGNLTYQCPANQNCLRNTRLSKDRNGLHILLSTTGMAVSCFSVREWGIVAIRNALDRNPENQAIVERLQAEQAVQTTALDDMGLQINITSDGKASVTTKPSTSERS